MLDGVVRPPPTIAARMSRLVPRRREELDAPGQAVWDTFIASFTDRIVDPGGGLREPWNAMVIAPDIGASWHGIGQALRRMSLEPRLREIAIISTGVRWQAELEWHMHARLAREQGVAEDVIEAIGNDEEPPFTRDDERLVHAIAAQLATTGSIDRRTYADVQAMFGDVGTIELVTVCGFYAWVSYMLNAFDVPPPDGADAKWPR